MGVHPVYIFCEAAPSHGETLQLNEWPSLQQILGTLPGGVGVEVGETPNGWQNWELKGLLVRR